MLCITPTPPLGCDMLNKTWHNLFEVSLVEVSSHDAAVLVDLYPRQPKWKSFTCRSVRWPSSPERRKHTKHGMKSFFVRPVPGRPERGRWLRRSPAGSFLQQTPSGWGGRPLHWIFYGTGSMKQPRSAETTTEECLGWTTMQTTLHFQICPDAHCTVSQGLIKTRRPPL